MQKERETEMYARELVADLEGGTCDFAGGVVWANMVGWAEGESRNLPSNMA